MTFCRAIWHGFCLSLVVVYFLLKEDLLMNTSSMKQAQQGFTLVASVDLRRGIDGLSTLAQQALDQPYAGSAFVFRNAAGNRIKVLHWDSNGVWMCHLVPYIRGRVHKLSVMHHEPPMADGATTYPYVYPTVFE
jgi:IS66 Orf2 like protein